MAFSPPPPLPFHLLPLSPLSQFYSTRFVDAIVTNEIRRSLPLLRDVVGVLLLNARSGMHPVARREIICV